MKTLYESILDNDIVDKANELGEKTLRDCGSNMDISIYQYDWQTPVLSKYFYYRFILKDAKNIKPTNIRWADEKVEPFVRILLEQPVMSWQESYMGWLKGKLKPGCKISITENTITHSNRHHVTFSIDNSKTTLDITVNITIKI